MLTSCTGGQTGGRRLLRMDGSACSVWRAAPVAHTVQRQPPCRRTAARGADHTPELKNGLFITHQARTLHE